MKRIDEVLERLPSNRRSGSGYVAQCPAHEDKSPSLSISEGDDGRVLLKCHAGCETSDICAAMGITLADLMPESSEVKPRIVATYDYRDEKKNLVIQVVRYEPKTFRQRRPESGGGWNWSVRGARVLPYRLPELLAEPARRLVIVEGEKDADNLARIGVLATCNAGGAGKWTAEHAKFLKGRHVVILPDNDDPGRAHAQQVAATLFGVAASIRVIELPGLPPKGDVSDWIAVGGTKEALKVFIDAAEEWSPDAAPKVEAPATRQQQLVKIVTLEETVGRYIDRLESGARKLIPLEVPNVDYAIGGGCEEGELILIGARPSHGKSAFALQVLHCATSEATPALIISEEMSALMLGKRTLQYMTDVPEEHWPHSTNVLRKSSSEFFEKREHCYIAESCGSLQGATDAIRWGVKEKGVKIVAVDYAQLIRAPGKSRYEQVTNTSIAIRQLTSELNIVILLLAQLGRGVEERARKNRGVFSPCISDLKDSGQFEQDADVILLLCWPHRLDSKFPPHEFQVTVGKNRNRAINQRTVDCRFLPSRQKFEIDKPPRIERPAETRQMNYDEFDAFNSR